MFFLSRLQFAISWVGFEKRRIGFTATDMQVRALTGFQGGLDSYKSFLGYLPEHDINIVILSNDAAEFAQLMQALAQVF